MKTTFALASFLLVAACAFAAEPVKSGPQVGAKVPGPFEPFNLTGPNADEECCLYCKFGNGPVVMIFARESSDPLTALLKKIDALTEKHKKQELGTCAIFIDKNAKTKGALKVLAVKEELKHLILATLDASPKGYDINQEADVTVLIYSGTAVKANQAFRKGELNDKAIEAIVKDVAKIVN
jgi:hypothetical protein